MYLSYRSIIIIYNNYNILFKKIRQVSNIFFNNISAVAYICHKIYICCLYFSYYNNKYIFTFN